MVKFVFFVWVIGSFFLCYAQTLLVEKAPFLIRSSIPERALLEQCLDDLEKVVPLFEKHLPVSLPKGEMLVLNLFATKEEYVNAIEKVGASAFRDNLAVTAYKTKESYLVVQPRANPVYLEMLGKLPEFTMLLIFHEMVHQWIYRAEAPNYKWWPKWYTEGMANYIAELCLAKTNPMQEGKISIAVDENHQYVKHCQKYKEKISLEEVLKLDYFENRHLFYTYAHSFYSFLATKPRRLKQLHGKFGEIREPRRRNPGSKYWKLYNNQVKRMYGGLSQLEENWNTYLEQKEAHWYTYMRTSEYVGEQIVSASFPGKNSILISDSIPTSVDLSISGEVKILGVGKKQAEIYLLFNPFHKPRFLKIVFGGYGFITLLAYADGKWQKELKYNVDVPKNTFVLQKWIPIKVLMRSNHLEFWVSGKKLFQRQIPKAFLPIKGSWGIGTYDEVVCYRNLVLQEE